jgi:hypothetical protein
MVTRPHGAFAVVAALWLATAPAARADDAAARAESLSAEAKKLLAEGRTSEACAKLAEAYRERPVVDSGIHLAECFERAGQVASALRTWQLVAQSVAVEGDSRYAAARERISALEPVAPRLVVDVSQRAAAGSDLEVRRDGIVLPHSQWGVAVLVDPGDHVVTASASGKRSWYTTVKTFPNGATLSVAVPELEDALSPPTLPPSTAIRRETVFDESVGKPRGDSQRLVGVGLGVVAVVAVGIGTVFGLQAKQRLDESNVYCHGNACDYPIGVEKREDAKFAAAVSTLSFGIGIGAALGGVLLYFLAPRDEAAKTAASRGVVTW